MQRREASSATQPSSGYPAKVPSKQTEKTCHEENSLLTPKDMIMAVEGTNNAI
jgi:hypothetical protein